MKATQTAIALSLGLATLACNASTLEYRVFTLTGEMPAAEEIVRLEQNNRLSPVISGSAPVADDGTFSDDRTTPFIFATKFTKTGEPEKTAMIGLGHKISGLLERTQGNIVVSLSFSNALKTMEQIHLLKNGRGIATPVFDTASIETAATTFPDDGRWMVLGGTSPADTHHAILLFRLVQ